ncbi:MAG TPA: 2-oxo acid dehydrogenase subunit E2 [Candidatus Pseudogracilibacillus intestinigallinarum]|uniref:Dihydrolipoamide acetyltransferase component of pyruvate dehydrogenase complex n=1 Tax=Candidatus Pseudogracilibacillus intestinigallinarum TaxID=2838742 RepID=A0A9D1TK22_9BACI|nr:2-oxo acid dehydrogenase subunit E2 [Candidatus Pseudogracilibacillus intestinigallinarum]
MSIEKIVMPKLGESVNEGTITTWLVKVGEHVNEYDPIAEVMTDKVNAEIPSSYTGTIKEIIVQEGETIEVDELICYIETDKDETTEESNSAKEKSDIGEAVVETTNEVSMSHRYSPAVLSLSQQHGIHLDDVTGTGIGGRITRKDIQKYIQHRKSSVTEGTTQTEERTSKPVVQPQATQNYEEGYELTGVRKAIADKMVLSTTEIPHAWMTVEVDVTNLVKYRNSVKQSFKDREGFNLTYFPFFIYAVAQALQAYPILNSTWQRKKIVQHRDVNISIAVANENELYVPVIQNADEKTVKGLAKSVQELANKAKTNQLTQNDMTNGTFTVNNTGTFGSVSSMGIINHPQVAILQVESIVKRPVIIDDMFAARDIVNLSLSLDHRVLDGLVAGRFLQHVKQTLESIDENTSLI